MGVSTSGCTATRGSRSCPSGPRPLRVQWDRRAVSGHCRALVGGRATVLTRIQDGSEHCAGVHRLRTRICSRPRPGTAIDGSTRLASRLLEPTVPASHHVDAPFLGATPIEPAALPFHIAIFDVRAGESSRSTTPECASFLPPSSAPTTRALEVPAFSRPGMTVQRIASLSRPSIVRQRRPRPDSGIQAATSSRPGRRRWYPSALRGSP